MISDSSKYSFFYELGVLLFIFFIFFTPIQATLNKTLSLKILEFSLINAVIVLHLTLFTFYNQSLLKLIAKKLKKSFVFLKSESLRIPINLILGIPFVWFLSSLYIYSVSYLEGSNWILRISSIIYLAGTFWYLFYLIKYDQSPISALWSMLSYEEYKNEPKQTKNRHVLIWFANLVIFYIFAINLVGFLRANMAETMNILNSSKISTEGFFLILRYSLWSLTILVCFAGYLYSLISVLWGKHVRNIDFTVIGWLTNGFCYPLFGIIIWQMVPSLHGGTLIITSGVWQYFMLSLELFLNVLYTLSIINLGMMFGVMSDKGLKTTGFFSVTRHPNYTLESMMFIVLYSSGLSSIGQWLAVSMYFFIYWLRSEREDNFMNYSNPGYAAYKKQTPYKFIPGLY